MPKEERSEKQIIYHVSLVSIIWNLFLSAFKLAAGIFGPSRALISDAIHSLSDVMGSLIVMLGARISGRAPDENHPYGHERYECIASTILGNILIVCAFMIFWSGLKLLMHPDQIAVPSLLPLAAAAVSIAVKEALYHYTIHYAHKLDSVSLKASAWDHRSDALSSVGTLAAVIGARLGFPILDPIASMIIAILIFRVAFNIFRETVDKVVDKSCPKEYEIQLAQEIRELGGIEHIDLIRTRQFASKVYVEIEFTMPGSLTLNVAHAKAKEVHDALEHLHPEIKHCMVHVNPDSEDTHDIPNIS